jgi:septal ring factor EnvC (AmiA/AmiB activator)
MIQDITNFVQNNLRNIVFIVPLILLIIIIIIFKCTDGKIIDGATSAKFSSDIINFYKEKTLLEEKKDVLENDLYDLLQQKHQLKNQLNISNIKLKNLKDKNNKLLDRKKQLQEDCRNTSQLYEKQMNDISKIITNETNNISADFITAFKNASTI